LQAFVNRGYFEKSAVMNVETPPTKIAFRTPENLVSDPKWSRNPFWEPLRSINYEFIRLLNNITGAEFSY